MKKSILALILCFCLMYCVGCRKNNDDINVESNHVERQESDVVISEIKYDMKDYIYVDPKEFDGNLEETLAELLYPTEPKVEYNPGNLSYYIGNGALEVYTSTNGDGYVVIQHKKIDNFAMYGVKVGMRLDEALDIFEKQGIVEKNGDYMVTDRIRLVLKEENKIVTEIKFVCNSRTRIDSIYEAQVPVETLQDTKITNIVFKERMTSQEVANAGILAKYYDETDYHGLHYGYGAGWYIYGVVMKDDYEEISRIYGQIEDSTGYHTGEYVCKKYQDNIEKLVLPSYIDNKPVIGITNDAENDELGYGGFFSGTTKLKELVIPNTVKVISEIGGYNNSIEKIYIPESVISLWGYNFGLFENLKEIIVHENNDNYSSEDGIFYNKDKTTLYWCPDGKTELYISDKVQRIEFVEERIEDLEDDGIEVNAKYVPLCPAKLEKIIVDKKNNKYCDIDGVLFSKDKEKLLLYPRNKSDETYKVPAGTKIIYSYAFQNAQKLKKVYIPNTLEYMGTEYQHEIYRQGMDGKWEKIDDVVLFISLLGEEYRNESMGQILYNGYLMTPEIKRQTYRNENNSQYEKLIDSIYCNYENNAFVNMTLGKKGEIVIEDVYPVGNVKKIAISSSYNAIPRSSIRTKEIPKVLEDKLDILQNQKVETLIVDLDGNGTREMIVNIIEDKRFNQSEITLYSSNGDKIGRLANGNMVNMNWEYGYLTLDRIEVIDIDNDNIMEMIVDIPAYELQGGYEITVLKYDGEKLIGDSDVTYIGP